MSDDKFDWLKDPEQQDKFMTFPADPTEFCATVANAMIFALQRGVDPVSLIDVVNQVTGTYLQDMELSKIDNPGETTKH